MTASAHLPAEQSLLVIRLHDAAQLAHRGRHDEAVKLARAACDHWDSIQPTPSTPEPS